MAVGADGDADTELLPVPVGADGVLLTAGVLPGTTGVGTDSCVGTGATVGVDIVLSVTVTLHFKTLLFTVFPFLYFTVTFIVAFPTFFAVILPLLVTAATFLLDD